MIFFPMPPSANENSENENQILYLYLSGSAFLVSFPDPNKQLFNVKHVLKFLNHEFSGQEIYMIYIIYYYILYIYDSFRDINIIY